MGVSYLSSRYDSLLILRIRNQNRKTPLPCWSNLVLPGVCFLKQKCDVLMVSVSCGRVDVVCLFICTVCLWCLRGFWALNGLYVCLYFPRNLLIHVVFVCFGCFVAQFVCFVARFLCVVLCGLRVYVLYFCLCELLVTLDSWVSVFTLFLLLIIWFLFTYVVTWLFLLPMWFLLFICFVCLFVCALGVHICCLMRFD